MITFTTCHRKIFECLIPQTRDRSKREEITENERGKMYREGGKIEKAGVTENGQITTGANQAQRVLIIVIGERVHLTLEAISSIV